MIVPVVVEGQSLRWYGRIPEIADNSIEFVQLEFRFPEDWDGMVIVAQFTQTKTYNCLLVNNRCFLPMELVAGPCEVSVFGYLNEEVTRGTTIPLKLNISRSGFVSSAETPIPPTPDLYAQLIEYFSSIAGSGGGGSGSGTINPEDIAAAVEDYLSKNPPEVPDLSDEVTRAETAASEAETASRNASASANNAGGYASSARDAASSAVFAANVADKAASDAEAAADRAEEAAKVTTDLDTTLTQEGKAADAKAVGDAISKLSGGNVENGEDGFSPIATVTQTDSGAVISITDKDGTTTATITNGKDGKDGADGQPGKDGYTPQKNVDYFDGQPGKDGVDGKDGSDGYTPVKGKDYFDGKDGQDGSPGKDGTSVTVESVSESTADGGSNVVTFSDGKTLTVKNGKTGAAGKDGSNGQSGADGVSPTVAVSKSGKVTTITIIDKNGTKTATINDGADGKDGTNATSYTIPNFWQSALNTAIAKVKSLQTGKNCVTFAHFSDNHTRNGYSGMLIAEVMKKCGIPYCFYNGDSIDSGYIANESVMIAQEEAFADMVSVIPSSQFCRSVGNHDGYWAVSDSENHTYTREQIYELFFRKQATAQNKQFGDDGTYFYVDDITSKVRFIVLNTNGGSVDDAQIAWFRDTALKVDEGWAVVVISHQPISNHYHSKISNAAAVRKIVTDSEVEIIGWFSGHLHRDRIFTGAAVNTTNDSEGEALGFRQVTITSDHTGIAYDDATKHDIDEDALSHAIDFITINRDTKTVNMTRLGVGNDRVYSYDKNAEPALTITWLNGKTCTYAVGNDCTVTDSSSYVISEKIPVEYGKTYNLSFTGVKEAATDMRWVGIDENNVVTEAAKSAQYSTGTVSLDWTPEQATTKFVRLRGYPGSGMETATELTAS